MRFVLLSLLLVQLAVGFTPRDVANVHQHRQSTSFKTKTAAPQSRALTTTSREMVAGGVDPSTVVPVLVVLGGIAYTLAKNGDFEIDSEGLKNVFALEGPAPTPTPASAPKTVATATVPAPTPAPAAPTPSPGDSIAELRREVASTKSEGSLQLLKRSAVAYPAPFVATVPGNSKSIEDKMKRTAPRPASVVATSHNNSKSTGRGSTFRKFKRVVKKVIAPWRKWKNIKL